MHPTISAFPSATFYASELMDGSNVKEPDYGPVFLLPPLPPENASEAFLRRIIGEGIPPLLVKNIFEQLKN
jgi:superfamily I DNA and/or RNA helicase